MASPVQEVPGSFDDSKSSSSSALPASLLTWLPVPEIPDVSTSPTPAHKTLDRVASLATIGGYETAAEDDEDVNEDFADAEAGDDTTQSQTAAGTVRHHSSRAAPQAVPLPETPKHNRRPRLHSRFASPRSSYSSRASDSDYAIGADYALQTGGGATLSSSTSSRPSQDLNRSISLASIASGITDSDARAPDSSSSGFHVLNDSDRMQTPRPVDFDSSHIQTPTMLSPGLKTPTESLLNSSVDKVEVPGTIARNFQYAIDSSPDSRLGGLAGVPANARVQSLALKEQGNIVDKLQKENFKIKMKLYYLEKRLAQVTDEEVKRMINENIELSTYKISAGKEIRALNKQNRDLQFALNERDARIAAFERNQRAENDLHEYKSDNEQELIWMRERISTYEVNIQNLQERADESDARAQGLEIEKQQLSDMVNSMSNSRAKGDNIEHREEIDLWKDLAESEAARKEQTIEENRRLRDEVSSLKQSGRSRPQTAEDRARSGATSTTLVELDALRHENSELRREVGAQTSMLSSRNREREKLYQEIEDLKMSSRHGGRSTAGDSILDRSASRAHARDDSHSGIHNRSTGMSDAERDNLEVANGELRDALSMVKMENQELSKQVETLATELERLVDIEEAKSKLQAEFEDLEEQTNIEIAALQGDRDEAWQKHDDQLQAFDELRAEAQDRIDGLDDDLEQRQQHITQLQREVNNHIQDNENLRNEIRMIGEGLEKIETDNQHKDQRVKELETEVEELNAEMISIDRAHKETSDKHEKLAVELESRQSEIVFLREEQDSYIIRITELETSLKAAQTGLESEQKRSSELSRRLTEERSQHQAIGSQEKKETSRMVNDLNKEVTRSREEARKLQKAIDIKESEIKTWKDRYYEFETSLKEILGDKLTSKNALVSNITQMQRHTEQLADELAMAKHTLALKEQSLKRRDTLLENSGMESQRLSDQLEKERSARTAERAAHEHWQQTHRHTTDTITVRNSRITELETGRRADRNKYNALETWYKEQFQARNELLLAIWHRIAALCGTEWQHGHSLVGGHLPTLEVVASKLPGFSKNLLHALQFVETMINKFRSDIRRIEKDLTKDYSDLERALDARVKRLDRLESQAQMDKINSAGGAGSAGSAGDSDRWIFRLKELERRLKAEREGRILDRNGARQRLSEAEKSKDLLRQRLANCEMRLALGEKEKT